MVSISNTYFFLKKNYISIIAIAIIGYVIYRIYKMTREYPELTEPNRAATNYKPVPYDSLKFKNFNISEMTCKDGTKVPAEFTGNARQVLNNLQVLRDYLGLPIHINSGYRTTAHNNKVGGAPGSAHLRAMATDIVVVGKSPKQVKEAILLLINKGQMQDGGIGLYSNFVHYDISKPRRW